MKLKYTKFGYDFYIGQDEKGENFYNVVPEGQKAPCGGYYASEYITGIKKVDNLFKQN